MDNKIYSRVQLKNIIADLNRDNKEIVFTNGCFDLLHVGHTRYLEEAKSYGDLLIVGLNSDSSVKALKGEKRPIISQDQRAELLSNLEMIDYITVFDEQTAKKTISLLKPDIYIKGGDYEVEELPEAEIVSEYGGEIILVKEIEGASTSNIIKKIVKKYQ